MPKTTTPKTVVALIGQFILDVDHLLFYNKLDQAWLDTQKKAKETSPTPHVAPIKQLYEMKKDEWKAMAAVRTSGCKLAAAMQSGEESLLVLKIVHCTEANGGGADEIWPLWPDAKAKLEQLAISLKREEQVRAASPGRRVTTLDIAKFANNRRKRKNPMSWANIHTEWRINHPHDVRVDPDPTNGQEYIRTTWSRHFRRKRN